MPPVNQAVLASAGVIAISVAVAAAIAIYESPEIRRAAEDLRRRIAIALHSLGDGINPPDRNPSEPLFNRPEDAEGFLQSRGALGRDMGVDADDETRRRQREELMYWNSLKEKKEQERLQAEAEALKAEALKARQRSGMVGSSFDDFMQEDKTSEKGTYVFNTGADVLRDDTGLVRRRGAEGVRGLNSSVIYANPFSDEHGIDFDDHSATEASHISPAKDEIMSDASTDIYNATEKTPSVAPSHTLSAQPSPPALVNIEEAHEQDPLLERQLAEDEYMTAGQEHQEDAYASIQAWAQGSSTGFYSPLPVSPAAPLSEPELISNGALTPTDSASLAGSGEDIGNDANSSRAGDEGRYYDVMSEDSDGMATPTSWTEVGSVVSESDNGVARA
ncbi:hypothetical protein NKR23_g4476 [Pleurostoma richardsiae]|uniref:Uncharacterized protein n=1 Tax=Pleurostoma richardsiae TaxID=41990 RepID=A0AA38RFV3_9PEZI|nr:hypothetical protein NKR23_g4476 [Pleurostoma richardsiae]